MICKGFFKNSRHLENHFAWLSGSNSVLANVQENMTTQIGYLETYLKYKDQTVDFIEKIAAAEKACETDYDGSQLFKYITILVIS